MATFLFDKTIFGPVYSRRLGISLGINLLPNNSKYCNFNCIYCECGLTPKINNLIKSLPTREQVRAGLESYLNILSLNQDPIDTLTFAGNGEPTLHPQFGEIINDTIELRSEYFPDSKIAVLSNATKISNEIIFNSLNKVDLNILKLDSGIEETIMLVNNPPDNFRLDNIVSDLKKFKGNLIIQSLFFRGIYKNKNIDNTSDKEVSALLSIVKEVNPKLVMIYTVARNTPGQGIKKVPYDELQLIAQKFQNLGIEVQVSG